MKRTTIFLIPIWDINKDKAYSILNALVENFENNISYEVEHQMIFIKFIVKLRGRKEIVNKLYTKLHETLGEF